MLIIFIVIYIIGLLICANIVNYLIKLDNKYIMDCDIAATIFVIILWPMMLIFAIIGYIGNLIIDVILKPILSVLLLPSKYFILKHEVNGDHNQCGPLKRN